MITEAGSLSVVVAALLVVGSVGGLAGYGSPAIADDLPAATSTSLPESSNTLTTSPDSSEPGDSTSTTVAGPVTTVGGTNTSTVAITIPTTLGAAATVAPTTAHDAITTGAVLAVPIGHPATASGATPVRGTQVQLHSPPPPPAIPAGEALPANSGEGRRVVYSKTLQRVWAVDESGTVVKTHRVSGKLTPLDPAPGIYRVWSRSRNTCAIHNPSICWGYMVRFATGARGGNIGFHEIPYQYGQPVQTVDQLGDALSGGCVRQSTPDAIWMWDWAQLGTVVVVLA